MSTTTITGLRTILGDQKLKESELVEEIGRLNAALKSSSSERENSLLQQLELQKGYFGEAQQNIGMLQNQLQQLYQFSEAQKRELQLQKSSFEAKAYSMVAENKKINDDFQASQGSLTAASNENKQLLAEIAQWKAKFSASNDEMGTLKVQVSDTTQKYASSKEEIKSLEAQLQSMRVSVDQKDQQIFFMKQTLEKKEKECGQIIATLQQDLHGTKQKNATAAETVAALSREVEFTRQQNGKVLQESQMQIQTIRQEAHANLSKLQQQLQQTAETLQSFKSQCESKNLELTRRDEVIAQWTGRAQKAEAEAQQLRGERERLSGEVATREQRLRVLQERVEQLERGHSAEAQQLRQSVEQQQAELGSLRSAQQQAAAKHAQEVSSLQVCAGGAQCSRHYVYSTPFFDLLLLSLLRVIPFFCFYSLCDTGLVVLNNCHGLCV